MAGHFGQATHELPGMGSSKPTDGPTLKTLALPEAMHGHDTFRPSVIFFMGWRGGCKTLTMSAFATSQKKWAKAHGVNWGVVSNYWLKCADLSTPYLAEELNRFPKWARRLTICIDEIASAFPSRRTMARTNLDFSNMLTQIRKRSMECMFTTQFPQVVEHQVLLQVDLFARCESYERGDIVHVYWFDYWGKITGRDFRKPWPPRVGEHDWDTWLFGLKSIHSQYRTDEVVAPVWSEHRQEILEEEGWRFTEEDDAPIPTAEELQQAVHGVDTSDLLGMVSRHQGAWNTRPYLAQAIEQIPSVTDRETFAAWLESVGFRTWRDRSVIWAQKKK